MNDRPPSARLGFIDSARGIAAVLVMLQHSLEAAGYVKLGPGEFGTSVINFGQAGVLTFFLVSGFVIPLSMEKKNSLVHFWVSRVFRLYPMFLFAWVLASLTFFDFRHSSVVVNFLAHVFYVQEYATHHGLNQVPNSWTLSLEMIWYILFSGLFLVGFNRKDVPVALGCTAAMLVMCAAALGTEHSIPMGRIGFLATCFCGLLFYRLWTGEISPRLFTVLAGGLVASVFLGLMVRFDWLYDDTRALDISVQCVTASWGLGYLIFLALFLGRQVHIPRVSYFFEWLGMISYSVYILHPFFIRLAEHVGIAGWPALVFVFVFTIIAAHLTYHLIEHPAIQMGRRVLRIPIRSPKTTESAV